VKHSPHRSVWFVLPSLVLEWSETEHAAVAMDKCEDTVRNTGFKKFQKFCANGCTHLLLVAFPPLAPPRSSPHALAGRGYSMPRRTGCFARSEGEDRLGSAPSRIWKHSAAMLHNHTAVVRHEGTSLLAGREGVHGKGASPRLAGLAGIARASCAAPTCLLTPRPVQEVRRMLYRFGPCHCRREPSSAPASPLAPMPGRVDQGPGFRRCVGRDLVSRLPFRNLGPPECRPRSFIAPSCI